MKTAQINTQHQVTLIPNVLRFGLVREMYEEEGEKVCKIGFEVLSTKWLKTIEVPDEVGNKTEQQINDFQTPVLFHSDTKVIPYGLYLLIEQYRMTKDPDLLVQINQYLTAFQFEGSLEAFSLQVTDIE